MVSCKKQVKFSIFMMKLLIINNLEFAQKQQKIEDSFDVSGFKRLVEMLTLHDENAGLSIVQFELTGDFKRFRQPSLHLHIRAKLPVICQRCLDEMLVEVDLNFDYLISNSAINELDENDEIDWLEASSEMDVLELIEDELLIAMPIAPTHAKSCSKLSMQSGEKPNPFAILKDKFK
jgi:uncharacterized protein